MTFTGRVAVVTGGGSGMGQRLCERMAAQGARVAALDLNEEGLARTAAAPGDISTYTVDVSDRHAVEQVVEKVTTELGPIDRLAAAAAIMPSDAIEDMDADLFAKVMDVNFNGVVYTSKAVLPQMLERGRGDMILFASLMGLQPQLLLGAYCASKHAVKAYAEILKWENEGTGVRFACVCPPAVRTPLIDQLKPDARSFLDALPESTQLTADKVIDSIESCLDKGRFWVMPGIAKPAAAYYKFAPRLFWKGSMKLGDEARAGSN